MRNRTLVCYSYHTTQGYSKTDRVKQGCYIKYGENLGLNKVLFYVLYHYIYIETILHMWKVWDFHERFSSIKLPRNLVTSTFSIFLSSILF